VGTNASNNLAIVGHTDAEKAEQKFTASLSCFWPQIVMDRWELYIMSKPPFLLTLFYPDKI
jgi:hypothetical protein